MDCGQSLKQTSRKYLLPFLMASGLFAFFFWLVIHAITATLPTPAEPLQFYATKNRQDIHQTFSQAIQSAKHSIRLCVYGITDKNLIHLLEKKASEGVEVTIVYDPSASSALKKKIPHAHFSPYRSKGLMHKKIFCIDDRLLFLGSANLTPASLRHHDNLVIGIDHFGLSAFIEHPSETAFSFAIQEQPAEFFLLPDPERKGLLRLLYLIDQAKNSIRIAMFTFTHPQIADALIRARQRGVEVSIAIDYYTGRGASRKTMERLCREGVTVLQSQGTELLHYKWGWIDGSTLIMGSANWTTAAFVKNDDFLLILFNLRNKQNRFLNRIWKIIETESTLML